MKRSRGMARMRVCVVSSNDPQRRTPHTQRAGATATPAVRRVHHKRVGATKSARQTTRTRERGRVCMRECECSDSTPETHTDTQRERKGVGQPQWRRQRGNDAAAAAAEEGGRRRQYLDSSGASRARCSLPFPGFSTLLGKIPTTLLPTPTTEAAGAAFNR